MNEIRDLGNGVYQVDALYTGRGIACLYCVVQDGEAAIIETGTAYSLPLLLKLLEELHIPHQNVRYVVPTHVHLDHAGGAGVMMKTFGNARLVIHPRGARHMIDPAKLVAATRAVYGDAAFERLYGEILPIDEARVDIADDGYRFKLGARAFGVIDTPGHAFHHFCVYDPQCRGLFSGDTFGLSYPDLRYQGERFVIPTTTPSQFSPDALLQSIDRIMQLQPQQVFLTHFGALKHPEDHVEQYRSGIGTLVEIVDSVKPRAVDDIGDLIDAMGAWLMREFDLDQSAIEGKLANDIRLNCQGLAHWYCRRDRQ